MRKDNRSGIKWNIQILLVPAPFIQDEFDLSKKQSNERR